MKATASWAKVTTSGVGSPTRIGTFKYDPIRKTYQVNWSTKPKTRGNFRIMANFGDGSVRTVDVVQK